MWPPSALWHTCGSEQRPGVSGRWADPSLTEVAQGPERDKPACGVPEMGTAWPDVAAPFWSEHEHTSHKRSCPMRC